MEEQLGRMMQFIQSMQNEEPASKNISESSGSSGNMQYDMLMAMRPMLSPKKQKMIDLIVKALEMQLIWDELRAENDI